ncbi:MAG: ATP-binding cassette domain-containing protein, partial [Candidatus Moraniibacteriota bacterium]
LSLVGASGVGKSTLLKLIYAEEFTRVNNQIHLVQNRGIFEIRFDDIFESDDWLLFWHKII